MPTLEWIIRGGVLFHRKLRWLPAFDSVTGRAFNALRTFGELPLVRVRFMAVHALCKYQRLLEVAVGMALGAIHAGVLAFQRELRFGVIEALVHRLQRDLLPAAGVVTGLATLRETSVVRILVTVRTLIKGDAHVLRFAIRTVRVALGALHLRVQAGQWVARLGVIELAHVDRLPIHKIVASEAILAETSLVLILVAGNAGGGNSQVGSAGILDLYGGLFLSRNVRWIMALIAG